MKRPNDLPPVMISGWPDRLIVSGPAVPLGAERLQIDLSRPRVKSIESVKSTDCVGRRDEAEMWKHLDEVELLISAPLIVAVIEVLFASLSRTRRP